MHFQIKLHKDMFEFRWYTFMHPYADPLYFLLFQFLRDTALQIWMSKLT